MVLNIEDIKNQKRNWRYVVSLGPFLFDNKFNKQWENRLSFIYFIMWLFLTVQGMYA